MASEIANRRDLKGEAKDLRRAATLPAGAIPVPMPKRAMPVPVPKQAALVPVPNPANTVPATPTHERWQAYTTDKKHHRPAGTHGESKGLINKDFMTPTGFEPVLPA